MTPGRQLHGDSRPHCRKPRSQHRDSGPHRDWGPVPKRRRPGPNMGSGFGSRDAKAIEAGPPGEGRAGSETGTAGTQRTTVGSPPPTTSLPLTPGFAVCCGDLSAVSVPVQSNEETARASPGGRLRDEPRAPLRPGPVLAVGATGRELAGGGSLSLSLLSL